MKKLFYLLCAAVIATFVSCSKLNENENEGDVKTLKIAASVDINPATKTYWSGGKLRWSQGDVITIVSKNGYTCPSEAVGEAAETYDFNISNWPVNETPMYAVFNGPNNSVYDVYKPELVEGKVHVTLRHEQQINNKGSFSKVANLSMGELVQNGSVYNVMMKNVCGLMKFTLETDLEVTKISIRDLNDQPMAGKVELEMVEGVPVAEVVDGKSEIVLTSNIQDSDHKFPQGDFYACVLPGEYTPQIVITYADGTTKTLTANSSLTIVRNKWMDFKIIDKKPEQPSQPITLTVDVTKFAEELRESQTPEYVEYTLTEGGYKFGFYNAYKNGTTIRLTKSTALGYVKFPAIDGYKLTNITLKSGAGSDKYIRLWSEDPLTAAKELGGFTLEGTDKTTDEQSFDIKDPQVGVAYYISSVATNTQFSKLVLTYEK